MTDPTVVLAPPLALVTIVVTSTPGWVPVAARLCTVAWAILVVVWLAGCVRRVRAGRRPGNAPKPFWPVVVLPGFLAITLVLVAAAVPLRARFTLSRDDLADAAEAVLTAETTISSTRIGSFPVQSIETDGRTVWFVTDGLGTTDRWGLVFSPDHEPDEPGTEVLVLDGDWYAFHTGDAAWPPI